MTCAICGQPALEGMTVCFNHILSGRPEEYGEPTASADELDRYIAALRAMPNDIGQAVRAIDHAEARHLPPLEQYLAGAVAREAAAGTTEREWLRGQIGHRLAPALAGQPHDDAPDRLAQAIANLMEVGLWPW